MDDIQRTLIKAGRKDLAQEYYLKVAKSFPGRAWEGKLNKIDTYLEHVYDLMSQSDKNLKDNVFHAYYRHYNDGDFKSLPVKRLKLKPEIQKKYEIWKNQDSWSKKSEKYVKMYEEVLEAAAEEVMKILFNKYKKSISRAKVNFNEFKKLISYVLEDFNEYWIRKLTKHTDDKDINSIANKLNTETRKWQKKWMSEKRKLEKKIKDDDSFNKSYWEHPDYKKLEKQEDKEEPELSSSEKDTLKKKMKEILERKQSLLALEDLLK